MTTSIISRTILAACSLMFLAITGITAVASGGQYIGIAIPCGAMALGLALAASYGRF